MEKSNSTSPEFLAAKAECEATHGVSASIWTPKGGVVCRPPGPEEYNRAADAQSSAGIAIAATEASGRASNAGRRQTLTSVKRAYVNSCIVYPIVEQACTVFDRYPGLVGKLAGELDKLAGEEFEVQISGN